MSLFVHFWKLNPKRRKMKPINLICTRSNASLSCLRKIGISTFRYRPVWSRSYPHGMRLRISGADRLGGTDGASLLTSASTVPNGMKTSWEAKRIAPVPFDVLRILPVCFPRYDGWLTSAAFFIHMLSSAGAVVWVALELRRGALGQANWTCLVRGVMRRCTLTADVVRWDSLSGAEESGRGALRCHGPPTRSIRCK